MTWPTAWFKLNLSSQMALPTAMAVTVLPILKLKKRLEGLAGGLYAIQTT